MKIQSDDTVDRTINLKPRMLVRGTDEVRSDAYRKYRWRRLSMIKFVGIHQRGRLLGKENIKIFSCELGIVAFPFI